MVPAEVRVARELRTEEPEETMAVARKLAAHLAPGDVLVLAGRLGSGKTVFVKGLAAGLGVDEEPTSPTFTLIHEYQGRLPLYHFDLYRLDDAAEVEDLGIEEYFHGPGVTALEWGDRFPEWLPPEYLHIHLEVPAAGGQHERLVRLVAHGPRLAAMLDGLSL